MTMKFIKMMELTLISAFLLLSFALSVSAQEFTNQIITLEKGWNIISTPKVLESHTFSASEISDNFDIYLLDGSRQSGWATMADVGQSEFLPLYGYFINNKTDSQQTLTLHYKTTLAPNDKLFERTFSQAGWYSIGVANDEYAKDQSANKTDTNNPSNILSLLSGKYDFTVDFTHTDFAANRRSVGVSDPWKVVVPSDIDSLHDFRETKGYAIYIKEPGAKYIGFQNDPTVLPPGGSENELIVKVSENDPVSTILQVEDDQISDWYTIFSFNLDSDDSYDELMLETIPVVIDTNDVDYESIVNDAHLVINGFIYENFIVENITANQAKLIFDVSGALITPGEIAEVDVALRFNALTDSNNGATVKASVSSSVADEILVFAGEQELSDEQIQGSVVGDTHTLMVPGMAVYLDSDSAIVTVGDSAGDDYAVFKIILDVTAFEQDVFINTNQAVSLDAKVVNSSGVVVNGMMTIALQSSADQEGNSFQINEGETESVTITVTFDAAAVGTSARLQLNSLVFGTSDGADNQVWYALPAGDFRTDIVTLVN